MPESSNNGHCGRHDRAIAEQASPSNASRASKLRANITSFPSCLPVSFPSGGRLRPSDSPFRSKHFFLPFQKGTATRSGNAATRPSNKSKIIKILLKIGLFEVYWLCALLRDHCASHCFRVKLQASPGTTTGPQARIPNFTRYHGPAYFYFCSMQSLCHCQTVSPYDQSRLPLLGCSLPQS
jgi:hypothetical protein